MDSGSPYDPRTSSSPDSLSDQRYDGIRGPTFNPNGPSAQPRPQPHPPGCHCDTCLHQAALRHEFSYIEYDTVNNSPPTPPCRPSLPVPMMPPTPPSARPRPQPHPSGFQDCPTLSVPMAPPTPPSARYGRPITRNNFNSVRRNLFGGNGPPNLQHWPQEQLHPLQPFPAAPPTSMSTSPMPLVRRSSAAVPNIGVGRECKFCKNNGESPHQYTSHVLRCAATNQLICPVLRKHVCETCGATGDDAHTKNYCPMLKVKMREALPNHLKRTRRQSDGSFRF